MQIDNRDSNVKTIAYSSPQPSLPPYNQLRDSSFFHTNSNSTPKKTCWQEIKSMWMLNNHDDNRSNAKTRFFSLHSQKMIDTHTTAPTIKKKEHDTSYNIRDNRWSSLCESTVYTHAWLILTIFGLLAKISFFREKRVEMVIFFGDERLCFFECLWVDEVDKFFVCLIVTQVEVQWARHTTVLDCHVPVTRVRPL